MGFKQSDVAVVLIWLFGVTSFGYASDGARRALGSATGPSRQLNHLFYIGRMGVRVLETPPPDCNDIASICAKEAAGDMAGALADHEARLQRCGKGLWEEVGACGPFAL